MEARGGAVNSGDLQHRAIRGSLATAAHVAISVPIATVATAVVARLLGPAAYGLLAYLTIATSIAIAVTDAGLTYGLTQWGAAAEAKGDRKTTRLLLSSATGYGLFVQLPLLVVFGFVLLRGQPAWILETYVLSVLLTVAAGGGGLVLSVQNRAETLARLAIVGNLLVQVAVVVVAWQLPAPAAVWAVRLVVGALVPLYSLALIDRHYRRAALTPRIPMSMPSGFWRFSLLMWGAGLLTLLVYSRSEVFVLKLYGQTENLGIFALAFGLSQQLTTPVDAMLGPLLPASAALLSSHPSLVRRAMLRGLRFSAFLSGTIAAILLPAIYFIVPSVYGRGFAQVASLFLVLGLVSTLQSVCSPVNALLLARRRGKAILGISGVSLVIDGLVALALIPVLGAWGAVAASVAAQITSSFFFVRTEFRVQAFSVREALGAVKAWLVAVVALGVALIVGWVSPIGISWVNAGLAAIVGGMTYLALIRGVGGILTEDDKAALLGAIPPRLRPVCTVVASAVTQPIPESKGE